MNDVIIEHKRAISFNSNNYVLKVEDTFVPVQQSGAATYSNAFAVQYVASQRGSIELPAGAVDETRPLLSSYSPMQSLCRATNLRNPYICRQHIA